MGLVLIEDDAVDIKRVGKGLRVSYSYSYCKSCGKEYNRLMKKCDFCGNNGKFLNGDIANRLSVYLELSMRGELQNYYKRTWGNRKSKMNEKREILYLLMHKDRLVESIKEGEIKGIIDTTYKHKKRVKMLSSNLM